MGSDDLLKKRRLDRKQRKKEYRTPRANSYLIVTEYMEKAVQLVSCLKLQIVL